MVFLFINLLLPNIEGSFPCTVPDNHNQYPTGCFLGVTFQLENGKNTDTPGAMYGYWLRANKSNATYQDTATVRPDCISVLVLIKL